MIFLSLQNLGHQPPAVRKEGKYRGPQYFGRSRRNLRRMSGLRQRTAHRRADSAAIDVAHRFDQSTVSD